MPSSISNNSTVGNTNDGGYVTDSINLRHFPKKDPKSPSGRETMREKIARQTREYLARGKTIEQVDHTANKTWGEPITRTRKEQVATMKRKLPIEIKRQKG